MHTELIIFGIYLLLVMPAVVAPLVLAAILDGRYHANYMRRHADRTQRPARKTSVGRSMLAEVRAARGPA